jgi:hypothetical protein
MRSFWLNDRIFYGLQLNLVVVTWNFAAAPLVNVYNGFPFKIKGSLLSKNHIYLVCEEKKQNRGVYQGMLVFFYLDRQVLLLIEKKI